MPTTQEKKFHRDLNKDRRKDQNIDNFYKSQGIPEQSIKDMGQPSLAESLKEVQKGPDSNQLQAGKIKYDQRQQNERSMARNLDQDKLQDRNKKDTSEKIETAQSGQEGKEGGLMKSKWQQVKNEQKNAKNKLNKIKSKAKSGEIGSAQAQKLANEAIKRAWNVGHSVVEEALLDIFYLAFLFAVPYTILCFGRLLVSMIGMLTIEIKGVRVKFVPGYGRDEILLRLGVNVLFLMISTIEWLILALLIWAMENPFTVAWNLSWGGLWNVIQFWF